MTSPPGPLVLVIDDHALVASSLVLSLRSEGLQAKECPAASTAGILAVAAGLSPGVALLDLDLGRDSAGYRIDGIDVIGPLREGGWHVLVLSGCSDRARIGSSLAAGALAWVSKQAPFPALLGLVRTALEGGEVMVPQRRQELIDLHEQRSVRSRELAGKLGKLTRRELEVLAQLSQGHRAQWVADHDVVSLATVRTQIRAILTKLGVSAQLDAVTLYRQARGSRLPL